MPLKLRLKRFGSKKKPFYRLVAIEQSFPRDGKVVAQLGYYDPKTNPKIINFNKEDIQEWLKKGALPTDSVRRLFGEVGIMDKLTIKGPPRGEKEKKKGKETEEKPLEQATEKKEEAPKQEEKKPGDPIKQEEPVKQEAPKKEKETVKPVEPKKQEEAKSQEEPKKEEAPEVKE